MVAIAELCHASARHVTHPTESFHTSKIIHVTHLKSHATHVHESCHKHLNQSHDTSERVLSHACQNIVSHMSNHISVVKAFQVWGGYD